MDDQYIECRKKELIKKSNAAYNKGLWDSVKWNPFKWYAYILYRKD